MAHHTDTGKDGELLAKEFLLRKGYEVLATNWRYSRAEIDIICRKNNVLVFAEVKTRRSDTYGLPEEAVSDAKQRQMIMAAEEYIENSDHEGNIRFDVISIRYEKANPVIMHIEDAFYPY